MSLLAGMAAIMLATPAGAQSWQARDPLAGVDLPPAVGLDGADRAAIQAVIAAQLAAFRRDDAAAAYGYATPRLQARYATAADFLAMIRRDYGSVYAARDMDFRDVVVFRGYPTQRVIIAGPEGSRMLALYMMSMTADGRWLIAGCVLVDAGPVS